MALYLSACAHKPDAVSPVASDSFALLSIQDGRLSWAGLKLGMTRGEAEQQLGTPLKIEPMESPACGALFSQTAIAERAVAIQWSDADASGALQSIAVTLSPKESRLGADKLAARAIHAIPALRPTGEERTSKLVQLLVLDDKNSSVLLLKSDDSEHVFYLSLANCLD